jgi:hypothetical protein
MRTFLGWVVLVAILGAAAYVLAPIVARPLVADAVRAVSPFGATPLEVDVDADPAGLLQGKIASIHVTGANLTSTRLDIGRLDVTANGVRILDRSFVSVSGSLESVTLRRGDGTQTQAGQVGISGPSNAIEATATVGRDAALEIVARALAGAGLPTEDLELIDGGVRLSVLGQRTDVAIGAVDGAVTIAGSVAGGGQIVVFGPEAGDPWRISSVSVSPSGLEIHALVDLDAVLTAR